MDLICIIIKLKCIFDKYVIFGSFNALVVSSAEKTIFNELLRRECSKYC